MPHTKLSKLQKFILAAALEGLQASPGDAQLWHSLAAKIRPDAMPIQADSLPHLTRNEILKAFFGLRLRKWRVGGHVVADELTNRIDRQAAGYEVFNRANSSFFHAIARLKRRGLLKPIKGGWQLTLQGINAAEALGSERGSGSAIGASARNKAATGTLTK
jgi:hypothetical protein